MVNLRLGRAGRERTAMGFAAPLPTERGARFAVTSRAPSSRMRHHVLGLARPPWIPFSHLIGATRTGMSSLPDRAAA